MGSLSRRPETWWFPIRWRIAILYFKKTAAGDFQSGESASNVFGQPDFNSSLATVLAGPHLISLDSSDQFYVADTGNNRIAVLPSVPTAGDNPPVLFSIASLSNPYGVFVDPGDRRDLGQRTPARNQVLRYASGAADHRQRHTERDSEGLRAGLGQRRIRSAIR